MFGSLSIPRTASLPAIVAGTRGLAPVVVGIVITFQAPVAMLSVAEQFYGWGVATFSQFR